MRSYVEGSPRPHYGSGSTELIQGNFSNAPPLHPEYEDCERSSVFTGTNGLTLCIVVLRFRPDNITFAVARPRRRRSGVRGAVGQPSFGGCGANRACERKAAGVSLASRS
ncbi:hypothetical protein LMG28727_06603 [Paraburkholderia kirstenboschensis]|nr:hypothetical protein LMG28727_06603 [Paraburkholderia kirstenboschensis]